MAHDLTLADFVGLIREVTPEKTIWMGGTPRTNKPFAAMLRKAQKPTPMRAGELVILKTKAAVFGPEGAAHMRFLRNQFPSMHRRYRKGAQKDTHWWMNEKDYALMRVFFGGRQWQT